MKHIKYIVLAALILSGCGQAASTSNKTDQSKKAKEAAESITFASNAEIDNIKKRLELTSDPALLGFVMLLNETGQPVAYYGVKGKITSSGKRLTPKQKLVRGDRGEWGGDFVFNAPSDEGTHGSSDPYIYFWTSGGQYIQWNGKYLYSDKPFRLSVKPLVIEVEPSAS